MKIRKLRAVLEEAEQAKKDKLAKLAEEKEAEDKEARDKEAGVEEAKDRGARGAAGEAEEEGRRRSNSSEENGDHPEEESDEKIVTGESRIISPAKRREIAENKRAFERKVEKEVERRMYELGLGGQYHDVYGENCMHVQGETQSTMGGPSRRWRASYETGA